MKYILGIVACIHLGGYQPLDDLQWIMLFSKMTNSSGPESILAEEREN